MSDTPPMETGTGGFTPDPDAWERYGPLVTASRKVMRASQARCDAVPQPAVAPDRAPAGDVGYGARGDGDLCDLVAALHAGETTPGAEVAAALDRAAARDADLHGVIALEADRALAEAAALDALDPKDRGPLGGAPYARKDLFYRAGFAAECGSPLFQGHMPQTTATVLSRLDAAGGVDIGRMAMAELAMSPTGFNTHTAHPRNPVNPAYVTGGSSSGSAVAVAGGYVRMALGTDTGGSIRHPAAMSGLTGLKPTQDRVSRAGVWPLSWSLDNVGPLCPSARDCALVMGIIAGPDPADTTVAAGPFPRPALGDDLSGLRIAVPRGYYFDTTTPAVQSALDAAIARLGDLGADMIQTGTPDMALVNTLAHVVLSVEASAQFGSVFRDPNGAIGRQVRDRLEPGMFYDASDYAAALRRRADVRADWLSAAMGPADAVLIPAIPREVPTIAETTGPAAAAVLGAVTHATRGINYLGLPALSAPCGADANGLPIAFQLVGRPCDEAGLIRIADAFQQVTKWHSRTERRSTT